METRIKHIIGGYYGTDTGRILTSRARYNQFGKCGWIRKWVKQRINNSGYKIVDLAVDGKKETKLAHRLIASAFIENIENKPQVNHKDCNTLNNNKNNLEWVTGKENMLHAKKAGRLIRSKEFCIANGLRNIGKINSIETRIKQAKSKVQVPIEIAARIFIESDYGFGQIQLGRMFNVSSSTAYKCSQNKLLAYDLEKYITKDENIELINKVKRIKLNSNNSTGFFGVITTKDKTNKYKAVISIDKKRIQISSHQFPIDAALARDEYIIKNNLNIPLNFINGEQIYE